MNVSWLRKFFRNILSRNKEPIKINTKTVTDWKKLKREIHALTALQRNVGNDAYLCDLAMYATYLYCVASHSRGHLHMASWNIQSTKQIDSDLIAGLHPRSFGTTIQDLDDQRLFIECAKERIVRIQNWMKTYKIQSIFMNLPVDFTKEIAIENDGTTVA